MRDCNNRCEDQEHVHEIVGSVMFADRNDPHNHRFATVSGEAIECGDSHVHEIKFRTDFYDGHYHEFCGRSSKAIYVGDGKHVHYANAYTECEDGHRHEFQVATLINSPIEEEDDCDRRRNRNDCDCD